MNTLRTNTANSLDLQSVSEFVYLDCNASTPPSPEVRKSLIESLQVGEGLGNASSIHWGGRQPKLWLRESRQALSEMLGCRPLELVFTSGGTESNNCVLQSFFDKMPVSAARREFITSAIEHPSVLKTFEYLEQKGAIVHRIPVDRSGQLDFNYFQSCLSERTLLVSLMAANNETGAVYDLSNYIRATHQVGGFFHSDMVQLFGKQNIDLQALDVDYASFSAHKFYALKGTGVLYIKKGAPMVQILHGGGQERHRRGGTENLLGIRALGLMANRATEVSQQEGRLRSLRNQMEAEILLRISQVKVTAQEGPRLPNTSSLIIEGVDGETLLMSLDLKGFAVSTGAACSSGNPEPSPVLLAMGLTRQEAQNSLRVSLGWSTTTHEIERFIEALVVTVARLRAIAPLSLENETSINTGFDL